MLKLSKLAGGQDDNEGFSTVLEVVEGDSLNDLAPHFKEPWSPGIFKNNRKNKENWTGSYLFGLDFDNGESVEQIANDLKGYEVVIGPTRHCNLPKGDKPACPRYRAVVAANEILTNEASYEATLKWLQTLTPYADHACKGVHRGFYPCTDLILHQHGGRVSAIKELDMKFDKPSYWDRLNPTTVKFIQLGDYSGSSWHNRLISSCLNLKEYGASSHEAIGLLVNASKPHYGHLTNEDMRQIEDVFLNRQVKIKPIPPARQLNQTMPKCRVKFKSPSERLTSYQLSSEKFLEAKKLSFELLPRILKKEVTVFPGFNLICGPTGSGKSTLAAAIISEFLAINPNAQVLVISNEDSNSTIYNRVTCQLSGISWKNFNSSIFSSGDKTKFDMIVHSLMGHVEVFEGDGFDTAKVDDLKAVISAASVEKHLIIFDYFQTVYADIESNEKQVDTLKRLGQFLKDYTVKLQIPLIVFAQARQGPEGISERVFNDKSISHHSVLTIEIIRSENESRLKIWKDRHGGSSMKEFEYTLDDLMRDPLDF